MTHFLKFNQIGLLLQGKQTVFVANDKIRTFKVKTGIMENSYTVR